MSSSAATGEGTDIAGRYGERRPPRRRYDKRGGDVGKARAIVSRWWCRCLVNAPVILTVPPESDRRAHVRKRPTRENNNTCQHVPFTYFLSRRCGMCSTAFMLCDDFA